MVRNRGGLFCAVLVWWGGMGVALAGLIPPLEGVLADRVEKCVTEAAAQYGVEERLLEAVIMVESSRWPYALAVLEGNVVRAVYAETLEEAQGLVMEWSQTNKDFAVGLGQIHSVNIRQWDINPVALLDPCVNLQWAAFILRRNFDRYGLGLMAVERYNGRNAAYPGMVYREWRKLGEERNGGG